MPYAQHDFGKLNDEEIIALYKSGEKEAFKNLIDRYTIPLYNFTARITNRIDTSDIVQEIFIKIWKNLNNFDREKASFKTWIFTIARNTVIDFSRKRERLLFSDMENNSEKGLSFFEENIPDENIIPFEALQKLQDKEFLNNTLKKLLPDENEILVLHYQEDMTFDEIGKVLNKSLNTVKSKHRRTLIKLRKMLD